MLKPISIFLLIFYLGTIADAQVILPVMLANNPAQNTQGVGPTAIAAGPNGTFAVAWQDWNEYGIPVPANPRIAVQMFASDASAIGPLNLFNGESRATIIYQNDYLSGDIDLEYLPNGYLLVGVEHEGLYDNFSDWIWSYETGIGALTPAGAMIDMVPGSSGIIQWYWANDLVDNGNMRLDVGPDGNFIATAHGPSYNTDMHAVILQHFDANANYVGSYYTPHLNDLGPNYNHLVPDVATNGNIYAVAWEDGRQDNHYDISIQFYNASGLMGGNQMVNSGDPAGTYNLLPCISMNPAGNSVVVWADSREGSGGEIFGQRYNSSGQPVGDNFQVSDGQGDIPIFYRPEVAIRNDGSFMVVWSDSIPGIAGVPSFRARFRQFDASANPTGPATFLPGQDIPSGHPCVATNGTYYYCSWLDVRIDDETPNVYVKIIDNGYLGIDDPPIQQSTFNLQHYPNPASGIVDFRFSMVDFRWVSLKIYDLQGREVARVLDGVCSGDQVVRWDATNLPAGIYFYLLRAEGEGQGAAGKIVNH